MAAIAATLVMALHYRAQREDLLDWISDQEHLSEEFREDDH